MKNIVLSLAAVLATATLVPATGFAASVYSTDFNSGLGGFTGAGSSVSVINPNLFNSPSLAGHSGFSGQFLFNDSPGDPATGSILTLNGLGAHSALDLSFSLGLLGSWDGLDGSVAPDLFNVTLNDVLIFQTSINTASGTPVTQPAGVSGAEGGSGACYYLCFYGDATFLVNLTGIAHSGTSATFKFFASGAGWQGGGDEAWGIDNVNVAGNAIGAVPLPAGLPLLAGCLSLLGALKLRRKKSA